MLFTSILRNKAQFATFDHILLRLLTKLLVFYRELKKKKKHQAEFWPSGGVGRNTLLPVTTKRRIATNLKTENHNCQKIKLHGSLTEKV